MKRLIAGVVLAACAILVYGRGLAEPSLTAAEQQLAAQAVSLIAGTGPRQGLYVRAPEDTWLAPLPVFTTAALIKLLPSAPVHQRLAALLSGVADVVLLYAIVVVCVQRVEIALAAGGALLLTPAHAVFSRTAASEGIWPLPFLLTWALCNTVAMQQLSRRRTWLFASGVSLFLSALAQASAVLMIPVLATVSLVVCRPIRGWRRPAMAPALAVGIAVLLVSCLVALWTGRGGAASRWLLQRAHIDDPVTPLRLVVWQWGATVSGWFWNFFLPSHLFLSPAAQGFCGLFPTMTVVPMAAGVFALAASSREDLAAFGVLRPMIVAVWIAGPLSAAIASHPPLDGRALIVVPFGVLLGTAGALALWRHGGWAGRVVLVTAGAGAAGQAIACWR